MWLRKLPENFELVDPGILTLRIGKIPGFILGKNNTVSHENTAQQLSFEWSHTKVTPCKA